MNQDLLMRKRTIAVFASVVALFLAQYSHAQLFPNGDFEPVPAATICQCPDNFTCGNDSGRVVDGVHPVFTAGTTGGCIGPTNYFPQLEAYSGNCCTYFYAGADKLDFKPTFFCCRKEIYWDGNWQGNITLTR